MATLSGVAFLAMFCLLACSEPKSTVKAEANSSGSSALPIPPSNAKVFTSLEQLTGWQSCHSTDCAGGSGTGTYWIAQNQSTPSLSGHSVELYNEGVWANALWWLKLGANGSASNFLWDFYVQVDAASLTAAQALEFDLFQAVNGYSYMVGSQCDYGARVWEIWDAANGNWVHTTASCPNLTPGEWHHIQWFVQRDPVTHSYRYATVVVDGTAYSVNQTYTAKYMGWADELGIQFQLDVNGTGAGYHEWVDNTTLTVW